MTLTKNTLYIKVTCSICCGKNSLRCLYCDSGISLIECSHKQLIKIIETFIIEDKKELYDFLVIELGVNNNKD